MSDDENIISDLEYVETLMSDFELTPEDSLADLIEALKDEESEEGS